MMTEMTDTTKSSEIGAAVGTLVAVSPPKNAARKSASPSQEELATARDLVKAARDRGVALTGPGGLLKALTRTVLETALDKEMNEHLGYDKHARRQHEGRNLVNSRNGKRSKTVLSDAAGEFRSTCPATATARSNRSSWPSGNPA